MYQEKLPGELLIDLEKTCCILEKITRIVVDITGENMLYS